VFKKLLLLSILSLLGFLGWKHFTAAPPPVAISPEQEVAALVEQSVMPAKELAALCAKYPKLVTQALKHKPVAVSGVLSKGLVSGVNSNDISLELAGTPQLKISFQSDFGKKERWGSPAIFRFQKRGKEIYAISVEKPDAQRDSQDKTQNSAYPQIDATSEGAALQSIVGTIAKAYGGNTAKGGSKKSDSGKSPSEPALRVLCKEGSTLTLRGEFRHIGAGWIKCDLLELP
jgi:hypothetical protein